MLQPRVGRNGAFQNAAHCGSPAAQVCNYTKGFGGASRQKQCKVACTRRKRVKVRRVCAGKMLCMSCCDL
eukprot:1138693-Pelagomonas_calceolata.AAC.1